MQVKSYRKRDRRPRRRDSTQLPLSCAHLSACLTAFLDVLGLGDRILAAETNNDFDRLIADIELIQRAFEFRSKNKYVKEAQAGWKKSVLAFSDSVVVNLPLHSKSAKSQGRLTL